MNEDAGLKDAGTARSPGGGDDVEGQPTVVHDVRGWTSKGIVTGCTFLLANF
jgi:hypothetical protein